MKLAGRPAALILTREGQDLLVEASVLAPEQKSFVFVVHASEDLGLWLRVSRKDGMHLFLLQWHYILGIDIGTESSEGLGLRAQFG